MARDVPDASEHRAWFSDTIAALPLMLVIPAYEQSRGCSALTDERETDVERH